MHFDPTAYGSETGSLLALGGDGRRAMPLTFEAARLPEASRRLSGANAQKWFPGALSPDGALSGLWLYFSCFDESHRISQDLETAEGSFWHGIAHRREPDASNAAYWFRRVGWHPIFPALRDAAGRILADAQSPEFRTASAWDPFAFIDFCESARRRPGSEQEKIAMDIQLVEWQLLFDYCARPAR
jgi:hypothetical protein